MSEVTPSVRTNHPVKPTPWALVVACLALGIAVFSLFASCAPQVHEARVQAKLRQHQVGMTATLSTALNGPPTKAIQGNTIDLAKIGFYPNPPAAIPGATRMHVYEYWDLVTCVVEYYDEDDRIIFVYVGRT